MNLAMTTDGRNFATPKHLRAQAIKALGIAKALEAKRKASGAHYVELNRKTRVLKAAKTLFKSN